MVRRLWRVAAILTFVIGCTPILLSTCTASPAAGQPMNQPAGVPPADLRLAHLQQAAAWYNRYHALAPDDLLGPSTGLS